MKLCMVVSSSVSAGMALLLLAPCSHADDKSPRLIKPYGSPLVIRDILSKSGFALVVEVKEIRKPFEQGVFRFAMCSILESVITRGKQPFYSDENGLMVQLADSPLSPIFDVGKRYLIIFNVTDHNPTPSLHRSEWVYPIRDGKVRVDPGVSWEQGGELIGGSHAPGFVPLEEFKVKLLAIDAELQGTSEESESGNALGE